MAHSSIHKKNYALKVYPIKGEELSKHFLHEARLLWLCHMNVIQIIDAQPKQCLSYKGKKFEASYLLMAYAPYGDFTDLLNSRKISGDVKLIRTYFRQLIDGIEYLHSKGIAHLDLKPENLLIGEDFLLKITDFDSSYSKGDRGIIGKGTPDFRAPEMGSQTLELPFAADIYSAGIIMFVFLAGCLPCTEQSEDGSNKLLRLMRAEDMEFWNYHQEKNGLRYDADFAELFFKMVKQNPKERIKISEIKQSKWYVGEVYSMRELRTIMTKIFS